MAQPAAPNVEIEIAADDYVLRCGHPEDPARPTWYLFHGPPSHNNCIASFGDLGWGARIQAQCRAQAELRRHAVRVTGWKLVDNRLYLAVTAPARGGWQVIAYAGRDGTVWRRGQHGWRGVAGPSSGALYLYPTVTDLENAEGPLTVIEVDHLPKMAEELAMFAARTTYHRGWGECIARECNGFDEAGGVIVDPQTGRTDPDRQVCIHVEERIASGADAIAMNRVRTALEHLRDMATVPEDRRTTYSQELLNEFNGILQAVESIEHAMQEDDD